MSEHIYISRRAGEVLVELLSQCAFNMSDPVEKFAEAKEIFEEVTIALSQRLEEGTE